MLNEIFEYNQYTDTKWIHHVKYKNETIWKNRLYAALNEKNDFPKGIKPGKCNLAGIPRALTVIARHQLSELNYWNEKNPQKRSDLRNEVIKKLNDWCFDDKKNEKKLLIQIESDFGNNCPIIDTIKTKNKENSWASSHIYQPLNYDTPNLIACNFARVLSEAITLGPLKTRRIKCSKKLFNDIYEKGCLLYANNTKKTMTEGKNTDKTKSETLLIPKPIPKLTNKGEINKRNLPQFEMLFYILSSYLIACQNNGMEPGTPVYISRVDIANWKGYQSFVGDKKREKYYFDIEGKQCNLFEVDDYHRWTVNVDFLRIYDIVLETADENGKFPKKEKEYDYIYEKKADIEVGGCPRKTTTLVYPKYQI